MTAPRRITLDPTAPLRSLREGISADLTQQQVADARGIAQGSVSLAESAGAGTSVRTLLTTAEALGYRVRIVAERSGPPVASHPRATQAGHHEATAPTGRPTCSACGHVYDIIRDYDSGKGMSLADLAAKYSLSRSSISRIITRHDARPPLLRRHSTEMRARNEAVLEALKRGDHRTDIAKAFGVHETRIGQIAKAAGIKPPPRKKSLSSRKSIPPRRGPGPLPSKRALYAAILEMIRNGASQAEAARAFGLSRPRISTIVKKYSTL